MLRGKLDAAHEALRVSKNEASQVRANWAMVKEQAHNMMNLLVELRTWVQTLQLCVQAACDAAFPVEIADNPIAIEECLHALSAHLRAMVSEAIRQGTATVLVVAQL